MSEENTVEANPTETPKKEEPKETSSATEDISAEDFAKLEKELNMANDSLVSKEVADKIKAAKEETRKEVEKEMQTNLKIKELEEQLKKKDDEKVELQKKTAEQLESFKSKLDTMAASRAVVETKSPFDKEEKREENTEMSDAEANEIEKASYQALIDRKRL